MAYFNAMADTLNQPNTINLPATNGFSNNSFETLWLNRAFDNYVLNDAELEPELADAETFTKAFQECAVNPPAFNRENPGEYFQFFFDCASRVDPTISEAL
jgi:hypothetical protein